MRPRAIVLACGDGNFYANHLRWTSWTQTSARATGVGHQNDCKPDCAAGHFQAYPIALRLSKVVGCPHAPGVREFAEVRWQWTKPIPALPGIPRSGSETFTCHRP